MKNIIITTPEEVKEIISDCLKGHLPKQEENPKLEEQKHLYSISELADFLGCSIATAQKLKNSRKIRFRQFGRKLIFDTNELLEDLEVGRKTSR